MWNSIVSVPYHCLFIYFFFHSFGSTVVSYDMGLICNSLQHAIEHKTHCCIYTDQTKTEKKKKEKKNAFISLCRCP